jgi:hypothetical protein
MITLACLIRLNLLVLAEEGSQRGHLIASTFRLHLTGGELRSVRFVVEVSLRPYDCQVVVVFGPE